MILNRKLIESAIATRGQSYKEIAKAAGISEQTLQSARAGGNVRPSVAGRIAKVLELSTDELIVIADNK